MFTAALWEVIFSDCKSLDPEKDEEQPNTNYNNTPEVKTKVLYIFFGIMAVAIVWCFWFFSPFVYGDVSLAPEQVVARKWLNMELNFAK